MNKHYTYNEWLKECNTYEDTYKKYFELQKETDELWERIDKAVEYINKFEDSPEYIDAYDITYWQDEVKNILKGEKDDD